MVTHLKTENGRYLCNPIKNTESRMSGCVSDVNCEICLLELENYFAKKIPKPAINQIQTNFRMLEGI